MQVSNMFLYLPCRYNKKHNIMTFKEAKIGQRFMTIGADVYTKRDEETATDISGYNIYRFSSNKQIKVIS